MLMNLRAYRMSTPAPALKRQQTEATCAPVNLEPIELSERDRAEYIRAILTPPEANASLAQAMRRYRELVGK
jgi:uncharacterized protein (DUF1778 family)